MNRNKLLIDIAKATGSTANIEHFNRNNLLLHICHLYGANPDIRTMKNLLRIIESVLHDTERYEISRNGHLKVIAEKLGAVTLDYQSRNYYLEKWLEVATPPAPIVGGMTQAIVQSSGTVTNQNGLYIIPPWAYTSNGTGAYIKVKVKTGGIITIKQILFVGSGFAIGDTLTINTLGGIACTVAPILEVTEIDGVLI